MASRDLVAASEGRRLQIVQPGHVWGATGTLPVLGQPSPATETKLSASTDDISVAFRLHRGNRREPLRGGLHVHSCANFHAGSAWQQNKVTSRTAAGNC